MTKANSTSAFGLLIGGIAIDLIGWPPGFKSADMVDSETIFHRGLIDGPVAAVPSLFATYFICQIQHQQNQVLRSKGETKRQIEQLNQVS